MCSPMSERETPLQRRQRLAERPGNEPITTSSEWELEQGASLWPGEPTDPRLREFVAYLLEDALITGTAKNRQPLGDVSRSVVELRIWGRLTFQEIADELGLTSRGAAQVYFERALDTLRRNWDDAVQPVQGPEAPEV